MKMRNVIHGVLWMLVVLLAACANRGTGPQGGPRDTIPPHIVKEIPLNGTLNYKGNSIDIYFDEYVQLADIQKNVIISPPQPSQPILKAIGKHLHFEFQEPLIDSTTYTINFGSAICDYNEKTPLTHYSFSFATGNSIDSLEIAGIVVDASNLNSVASVVVGIHQNTHDSALSTLPFTRISRTDDQGFFTIQNIRDDAYRVYALNDVSRDYVYQPGESMAYCDSLIHPYIISSSEMDTLWRDTMVIDSLKHDTVMQKMVDTVECNLYYSFYPSDLVLWYFTEDKQRLFFQGVNRPEPHLFTMIWSAPCKYRPQLRELRPSQADTAKNDSNYVEWMPFARMRQYPNNDTLMVWLTDSAVISMDSLYIELKYWVTDSVYALQQRCDTVVAVYRAPRMSDKAKEAKQREKNARKLQWECNASSKFNVYDTLRLSSEYPIDSIREKGIHLYHKVDTNLISIPFRLQNNDSLKMTTLLVADLKSEESYELHVDSATAFDIYGKCNDKWKQKLTLRSMEEYSSLTVHLTHYDPTIRLQLLNEKDEVVREMKAQPDGVKFQYLEPKVYYLRLYYDTNNDGKWTTGDWSKHRQPEAVYYYPRRLKLRANWDFEESFDHFAVPQLDAKPDALRPKPKT